MNKESTRVLMLDSDIKRLLLDIYNADKAKIDRAFDYFIDGYFGEVFEPNRQKTRQLLARNKYMPPKDLYPFKMAQYAFVIFSENYDEKKEEAMRNIESITTIAADSVGLDFKSRRVLQAKISLAISDAYIAYGCCKKYKRTAYDLLNFDGMYTEKWPDPNKIFHCYDIVEGRMTTLRSPDIDEEFIHMLTE